LGRRDDARGNGNSRASLVCQAMVQPKSNDVRRQLEDAFGAFGLPKYMLSDGGPPFSSSGLGRLSRLGVWLVRLGVTPVLIEPGRPDQNGRHERFHETLKVETAMPLRSSIRGQQQAFDRFQETYNHERPHEALGKKPPGEVYELSTRSLPSSLPEHQYADGLEQRSVRTDGSIKWDGGLVFVGEAFAGETVRLQACDDGLWHVQLGPLRLGILHERSRTIVPTAGGVTHVPGQKCHPCSRLHSFCSGLRRMRRTSSSCTAGMASRSALRVRCTAYALRAPSRRYGGRIRDSCPTKPSSAHISCGCTARTFHGRSDRVKPNHASRGPMLPMSRSVSLLHAVRLLLLAALVFAFAACKAHAELDTPTFRFRGAVEIDPAVLEGAPPGRLMGRGTVTLENGETFKGEFYDSNGDNKPDAFRPDANQSAGGVSGVSTGSQYFRCS
jgi:hypothetical protein